ncbi:hypothetical protein NG799_02295 [Laspinema sp. D1]|uniref:Uncharacterized protein n=1 Tax=Laspinema palackyanum D2a TaxID=2953684 RepID=A0ABT2MK88_9CYAN|nr:hypothetical protein [Laspinema sp. D2a]
MTKQVFEEIWQILPTNSKKALLRRFTKAKKRHYFRPRNELFRMVAQKTGRSEQEAARILYQMRWDIEAGRWKP